MFLVFDYVAEEQRRSWGTVNQSDHVLRSNFPTDPDTSRLLADVPAAGKHSHGTTDEYPVQLQTGSSSGISCDPLRRGLGASQCNLLPSVHPSINPQPSITCIRMAGWMVSVVPLYLLPLAHHKKPSPGEAWSCCSFVQGLAGPRVIFTTHPRGPQRSTQHRDTERGLHS
ncbi:hypothetical protein LX36DRAFT_664636 [Colletotrichum falcatum]|nr:hypothetical protein LX36DRAFT_664636 [Colletotrichum falcatum]